MGLSDTQRRAKRAKQRERDAGHWLLMHDGEDQHWRHISSSTGRVGHITGLQFDVVSAHYVGEIKNVKVPAMLLKWWTQISQIAVTHGKEPVLIWYPSNFLNTIGIPKKTPPLHIITEARHEELLNKERALDSIAADPLFSISTEQPGT